MNPTEVKPPATVSPTGGGSELSRKLDDPRVTQALEEYLAGLEAGQKPDRQQLQARYPDLAEALAECLAGLDFVQAATPELEEPDGDQSGAATAASAALRPEGPLGDFRIVREIGRGGMGVVYEAVQISLGRRVALKVLPFAAALDSKQLQRFKNEAQAAAHLHHTNIVPVILVGCERGVHFYAMQYIEGQTLAAVIQELRQNVECRITNDERMSNDESPSTKEPVPSTHAETPFRHSTLGLLSSLGIRHSSYFRTVANLGVQAAEALEHAHQLGIIHRDIKPANLLVDAAGRLWVTDFGLAHCQSQAGLTMSGDLVGTLRYMSPEQALAKRAQVDHRTDIYSLGVTLYELLTLEHAFDGRDREELLRQIAFEEPRPPRRLNPAVPAELETIVRKAIEKNPGERYATAQELADDLERYLRDEPIRAKRPSLAQRLKKWARRHQAVVWSAGVSAVALLVVVALGLALSNARITREKKEKDAALEQALRAEELAKEQEHKAETRKAETAAVLVFVENKIFAAAQPGGMGGGLGHDVSLRKAVETALPFVEKSFTKQPLIEARLRVTLGISFLHLGEAAIAAEQFQRASALYTTELGPDDPDTLLSINNLAASYFALGRYAEALQLWEQTLALMTARLGNDHPYTLASMGNLASSYAILGRQSEALKLRETTLALMKAKLGNDHPDTLTSMSNLAFSCEALGRHAEALKLREETLALRKAKLGDDHPDTLRSMNHLARSYAALGRHAEALKLDEDTLAKRRAKLGDDHPDTLQSMNDLASSYATFGRHAEALKLREETLALRKAKLGEDHPETLWSMGAVAASLVELNRGAEAVAVIDECLMRASGKAVNPEMVRRLMDTRLRYFMKKMDAAGCRATAEMWEQLQRTDAESLYNAACFRAVTAAVLRAADKSPAGTRQADAEADRAMAWLTQAVAGGFRDAAHMKKDPDLDVLRGREDFRQLLTALETGKK